MNNNSVEQPDPDNIKMFVGQVPHDMDENDLRTMFEEYGRVHQINILRDKITGSHRGEFYDRTTFPIDRAIRTKSRKESFEMWKERDETLKARNCRDRLIPNTRLFFR